MLHTVYGVLLLRQDLFYVLGLQHFRVGLDFRPDCCCSRQDEGLLVDGTNQGASPWG